MIKSGLTLTVVFNAQSANYGEGFGNITVLKKMTGTDGNMYSYISRQAIRYNIVRQLGWDNTPVKVSEKQGGDKGVVQFAPEATIKDYPEIDLFGYMKTTSRSDTSSGSATTRAAVCRLSNAVSLVPYNYDVDYLNNMGLAKRQVGLENSIAQSEIHHSLYAYTITVDLDRVGIDVEIEIDNKKKADRVKKLLEAVQFLYRDIKGRRENLSPVFVVGGLYGRKNPYFEGRLKLYRNGQLNVDILEETINSCEDTKTNTYCGLLKGVFANEKTIAEKLKPLSVPQFFSKMMEEVDEYYG